MATYKIKDIEQLTGIKAHTLRIWESRYGLFKPDRTDTKLRVYNDEELQLLLNISVLNKNGYKISTIASWSENMIKQRVQELQLVANTDTNIDQLIVALMTMDELLFRNVINVSSESIGFENTFQQLIIPFLERIGVLWQIGTIHPAQEHVMSNLIRQRIFYELEKLDSPQNVPVSVILALPEHDWHEISLLFYHYCLRVRGVNSMFLGQSVPYDSLIKSIDTLQPKMVMVSWISAADERFIYHYFQNLKESYPDLKVVASGGQVAKTELSDLNVAKIRSVDQLISLLAE